MADVSFFELSRNLDKRLREAANVGDLMEQVFTLAQSKIKELISEKEELVKEIKDMRAAILEVEDLKAKLASLETGD